MTAIDANYGRVSFQRRAAQDGPMWLLPWTIALLSGACMVGWILHERPAAAPQYANAAARPEQAADPYGRLIDPGFARSATAGASNADARLAARLDAAAGLSLALGGKSSNPYGTLDAGLFPSVKSTSIPAVTLQATLEAVPQTPVIPASIEAPSPRQRDIATLDQAPPLPPARPAEFAPRRPAPSVATAAAEPSPADDRNIFQKLFGLGQSGGAAVAYAEPENRAAGGARVASLAATDRSSGMSLFARSSPPPGYDKFTAVYDISARVVYMPDGTRLEDHSGYGERLDDPRFVNERMRGATPPHLYELSVREELFHGVQALRLTPVGNGDVFGRAGLLAHPFMLGPNGDSNGCVSFADYDTFLRAYQQGQVRRLAVVAKLD